MTDDWDDDEDDTPAHTSDGKPRPNDTRDFDAAAEEIKSFVERVMNIDQKMSDLRDDKKELYGEMKARGFDRKAFDAALKVIKIREDRSKVEARLEVREIARLYLTALGEEDFEDLL